MMMMFFFLVLFDGFVYSDGHKAGVGAVKIGIDELVGFPSGIILR